MKKILTAMLALTMLLTALGGCSAKKPDAPAAKTPEELAQLYTDAINQSGCEMVQYNPVVTQTEGDDMTAMMLEILGLSADDMQAYGISLSMMNVKAYCIAAAMPAEGKTETVKNAFQGFIDNQTQSFETYLADQYEIAKNARLDVLADGTVLLAMCENSDQVFQDIQKVIEG